MTARTKTTRTDREHRVACLHRLADSCRPLKVVLDLAEPGDEMPQAVAVLGRHIRGLRRLLALGDIAPPSAPNLSTVQTLVAEAASLEHAARLRYLAAQW